MRKGDGKAEAVLLIQRPVTGSSQTAGKGEGEDRIQEEEKAILFWKIKKSETIRQNSQDKFNVATNFPLS